MKIMHVRLTFIEPVLGTQPANESVYRDYIATKMPEEDRIKIEDEVAALGVDEVVEKGMTIFPKTVDGNPFFYSYQIRGFFKGACSGLRKVPGTLSSKVKAYKKEVDQLVFVMPVQIPIKLAGPVTTCERSLRASTPQGERVSLAMSEEIPAGSTAEFRIALLCDSDEAVVREWLDYGVLHGIGQWRNSGKGRFVWEEVSKTTEVRDFDNDAIKRFAIA